MKKILLLILIAVSFSSYGQNAFKGATNTYKNKIDYEANLGSTFTARSLVDMGYVDSARNKARDSVVALLGSYKTITAYNSDTTAKTWDWADITGKPATASSTISKSWTIESPTASEEIDLFYTDVPITVSKLAEALRGSSPSLTYDIVFSTDASSGSPSELFGTDRAGTSTTGTTTTSFSDATIPAGSFIRLKSSALSGTTNSITITLIYSND